MNNILTPDKNLKFIQKYHLSSKLLLPGIAIQYVAHKNNINTFEKPLQLFNVLNIGFHSYLSTSSIITDYIKPKRVLFLARFSNIGLHFISMSGHLYYTFHKEMKN